ncbi:MAG TPA: 4'-phosphopantetheinyl transferase superfamily protein [Mycobacterium sp.]|nr:4'-phosphopantetheinyl transferase superfamily protein [Mycobacterium sp.]HTX96949.1 4'-phosphopantetheinyl transferase superfamily protein [Mycobacterium sp.]
MSIDPVLVPSATDIIKIWIADLCAVDIAAGYLLLSEAEQQRAGRIVIPAERRRMIARRTVLRSLLGDEFAVPPASLELERRCDQCGKYHPAPIVSQERRDCHWSTSSVDDMFVMATAPMPIGIDIESADATTSWHQVAQRYYTADEVSAIGASSEVFTQFWAYKEAFLKGEGVGLVGGLDRLCCTRFRQDEGIWMTSEQHSAWRFTPLRDMPKGFAGAVAVRGPALPLVTLSAGGGTLWRRLDDSNDG